MGKDTSSSESSSEGEDQYQESIDNLASETKNLSALFDKFKADHSHNFDFLGQSIGDTEDASQLNLTFAYLLNSLYFV
jgi:hypothetical protein